jgi:hypothetical protein
MAQLTQADEFAAPVVVEKVPRGQLAHKDAEVSPVAVENVPTGQPAHAAWPSSVEYKPAAHPAQRELVVPPVAAR